MSKGCDKEFFFLCFLCERVVTKSFKTETFNVTHCIRCSHKIPIVAAAFQAIDDTERENLLKFEGDKHEKN